MAISKSPKSPGCYKLYSVYINRDFNTNSNYSKNGSEEVTVSARKYSPEVSANETSSRANLSTHPYCTLKPSCQVHVLSIGN